MKLGGKEGDMYSQAILFACSRGETIYPRRFGEESNWSGIERSGPPSIDRVHCYLLSLVFGFECFIVFLRCGSILHPRYPLLSFC